MRELIKVKGRKDLVRDKASGGILSTDLVGLDKYRAERDKQLRITKAVEGYERLGKVEAELGEIKSMLKELLKKK